MRSIAGERQTGDEEGGGADHAVEGVKGEITADAGDAAQEVAHAAAQPGGGDGRAGPPGADGEAADRQREAVALEVDERAAGGVDQIGAAADGAQEGGDGDARIGLDVEVRRPRRRQVAPARAAAAAGRFSRGGPGAVGLPPGEERLAEDPVLDEDDLPAGASLPV